MQMQIRCVYSNSLPQIFIDFYSFIVPIGNTTTKQGAYIRAYSFLYYIFISIGVLTLFKSPSISFLVSTSNTY
jgi:hypothetical protein